MSFMVYNAWKPLTIYIRINPFVILNFLNFMITNNQIY